MATCRKCHPQCVCCCQGYKHAAPHKLPHYMHLQDPGSFFERNWEQKPAVFKATAERVALFQGLCSLPAVVNWLKQRQKKAGPLAFGVDFNTARYRNGVRETPNGEVRGQEGACWQRFVVRHC
eukprot:GHRQ01026436.1.p1 GENE.GHRQ01026436.1~~GHRQ01026436.1.p1  ORF type:complete len:123 (-),score=8.05 GHRQ01026436.1:281-649(-)